MADHTADEEFDPTVNDVSFEVEGDEDLDQLDDGDGIEPGSEGAWGTGVEGADQIMEDERVRTSGDEINEWADFSDEFGEDDSAAAEQGNRDQDQMTSAGDDEREVEQLGGDDWNLDSVGEGDLPADERRLAEGVDLYDEAAGLDGSVEGEDPLAGGPTGR